MLGLTACGDSDSDGATAGVAIPPPGTITSTNAAAVTSDVLDAFVLGGDPTAPVPLAATGAKTQSTVKSITLADFTRQQYEKALGLSQQTRFSPQVPTGPQPCSGGGTIELDISLDLTSMIVTYELCNEGGVITDGVMSLSNIPTTPPACASDISFSVSFSNPRVASNNFTVDNGVDVLGVNGFFDFSSVANATCQIVTEIVSGTSLSLTLNGETAAIFNFSISEVLDTGTNDYSLTFSGTVSSPAASGSVSASVTTPITGNTANTYPSGGALTISAGTASISVTINSNVASDPNAVTISLDADGIPGPDPGYPQDYSWDALAAL
jgi:hypothetical protein